MKRNKRNDTQKKVNCTQKKLIGTQNLKIQKSS